MPSRLTMPLRRAILFVVLVLTSACGASAAPVGPLPTTGAGGAAIPIVPVTAFPPNASAPDSASATLPAWLNVMFTDPNPPDNLTDMRFANFVLPVIRAAKTRIDVTSFDLTWIDFMTAIKEVSRRGVDVRMVLDMQEGKFEQPDINSLRAAGVSIVNGGRSSGLMHDKMIIVDSRTLFIGSWNMAYNDTYRNNNNLLRITSRELIQNYQAKFDEMYTSRKFGAKSQQGAVNLQSTLDGVPVENYFSPPDNVMDKLIARINSARRSVRFAAFTYTHPDLAAAMVAAAKRGVQVIGVIENRGASQGALPTLFCAGLPVRTDGNKYTMHHKFIVIDNETVITGSYNFTQSADRYNDDYIIIVRNRALADMYQAEFNRVYSIGETPNDVTC